MATARTRRLIRELQRVSVPGGERAELSASQRRVAARLLRWVLRTGSWIPEQPFFAVNREHLRDVIRELEGTERAQRPSLSDEIIGDTGRDDSLWK